MKSSSCPGLAPWCRTGARSARPSETAPRAENEESPNAHPSAPGHGRRDLPRHPRRRDGSYTTPTFRHAISRYALGDGAWKLNWNNDGDGYVHYSVTASPRV
ncbi:hypothetical protein [Streptomyces sp. NPDC007083]|uniref:hypothetical protein n=1 Tax=Streptomyces sp. NPDC007083 TaxID=3156913 RepID=UPI003405BD85